MLIYHASTTEVTKPDTLHSRENLDFGKGFYTTILYEQAKHYADRFALRRRTAYINVYEYIANKDAKTKEFEKYDEEWLDFVMNCRRGNDEYKTYDIIIGGIANDRIFNTIDLYTNGLISKEETLKRLIFEHPNQQMCFTNQGIIDRCIKFISSEKIVYGGK